MDLDRIAGPERENLREGRWPVEAQRRAADCHEVELGPDALLAVAAIAASERAFPADAQVGSDLRIVAQEPDALGARDAPAFGDDVEAAARQQVIGDGVASQRH